MKVGWMDEPQAAIVKADPCRPPSHSAYGGNLFAGIQCKSVMVRPHSLSGVGIPSRLLQLYALLGSLTVTAERSGAGRCGGAGTLCWKKVHIAPILIGWHNLPLVAFQAHRGSANLYADNSALNSSTPLEHDGHIIASHPLEPHS
jgi:hypothetical protein